MFFLNENCCNDYVVIMQHKNVKKNYITFIMKDKIAVITEN